MEINMNIKIIGDSGSDISQEEAKKLGITILPLLCRFDSEEYTDGVSMTHKNFYSKLIETDVFPTTSQVSPYSYEMAFREALTDADYVVCVTISSKLSGCYQSATLAAAEFDGKVFVIDSLQVSVAIKILILQILEIAKTANTIEEALSAFEMARDRVRIIAMLDTLEYLKKGGRISSTVAFAGTLLSIKPVVTVTDGEVILLGQARGSKAVNNKLRELIEAESVDYSLPCALGYTGLSDHLLQKYLEDNKSLYENNIDEISIDSIGCAIGTHVGPGAIAVAFFVK